METKRIEYLFGGFAPFERKLLVFSYGNFLLDFNLENGVVEFPQNISMEICKMTTKVDWFIKADDYLLATSMWGNHAYLYEPQKGNWIELEISCHEKPWGNFMDVFSYNGFIYILPRHRDFFVKIDLAKRTVLHMAAPFLSQSDKERLITCRRENSIYFFEKYSCEILIYDLLTEHSEKKKLPDTVKDIVSIRFYKDKFYILSGDGCLQSFDERTNVLEKIVEPIEEGESNLFVDLAITDQNIWLLPQMGEDIYIFDYKDNVLRKYDKYPDNFAYADFKNYSKFARGHEYQDKTYFGMHSANHLLIIHKNTGTAQWIAPILPSEQETYKFRQRYGLSFEENEKEISLHEYVEEIPQMHGGEVLHGSENQRTGVEIWKILKCEGMERR